MDANATNLYGQQSQPEETSKLLMESHTSLLAEIDNLPDEIKAGWMMAQEKCHPSLVGEEHRLMFLRCELFDATLAAQRIGRYWNKRIELFGEDYAFKPLHIDREDGSIMVKCTLKGLSLRFIRPMQTHDTDGRAILFVDPSRFVGYDKRNIDERMGLVRALWLVIHHVVMGNDIAQKLGVVVIIFPRHAKLSFVDRKLMQMNMESLSGCLPIRVGGIHVCNPPWFFGKIVYPLIKVIMPSRMRKRIRVHVGSQENVLMKLKQFGLEKDVLPSEIGGNVEL